MNHVADKTLLAASPWWRPDPGTNLVIQGGSQLVGTYPISGAKNAVLPLMVSALLTPHLVTLHNVPASLDVAVLSNLLQRLGAGLSWSSSGRTGLSLTLYADQVHPARSASSFRKACETADCVVPSLTAARLMLRAAAISMNTRSARSSTGVWVKPHEPGPAKAGCGASALSWFHHHALTSEGQQPVRCISGSYSE